MIKSFRRMFNYVKAWHKGQINAHIWFDTEETFDVLRSSPVPGVVMLAMLWMTCTVLLTLSFQKQHDISDWIIGQRVPYSVIAKNNFNYHDTRATENKRKQAGMGAPHFFRIDTRRTEDIFHRYNSFWTEISKRSLMEKEGHEYVPIDPAVADIVKKCSPELMHELASRYLTGQGYLNARERLIRLTSSGIIRSSDKQKRIAGTRIKTIDSHDRMSSGERLTGDMPDPALTGVWLADAIFPDAADRKSLHDEFALLVAAIIGEQGNLDFDSKLTADEKKKLADQVRDVMRFCAKGNLLIRKGDIYTQEAQEMLSAASKAAPKDHGLKVITQHIIWSFILLVVVVFLVTKLFPRIIRDTKRITIASIVMITSLMANYWALRFFDYLVRDGRIHSQEFIIDAVPVVLTSVVLTVLVGYRIGICCSFMVVSITSMMIMPDRSFELAMRWMATSAVAGLAVCRVKNYRAYFIRIFSATIPLVLALSAGGLLLRQSEQAFNSQTIISMLGIACFNGFSSAVLALVLVFILELIFNIDTDMALMGLSDFSHPLLERLKREAPGTMFHSITVATIAEDAAKAIHANPLRAKVGGLFHDIGKLHMPQYFIENNPDSSSEHMKLNPQLSSIIIRDHVKEGLILARQYRLFRWIQGAISTHHGDDLVKYFYNAARKQRQQSSDASPVLESQFRYAGRPPRAKELVIVSLADACEAATRSLAKPTQAKIKSLVENIFFMRYQGGQLRNAELTLTELDKVKESFIKTLLSIYHGRIAYTQEDENEENSVQVEKPESSGSAEK